VVLALAAWFIVLSRLRVSGPEEFLGLVTAIAGGADDGPENAGEADGNPSGGPPGL
jgi:hypothetical protein